MFERFTDRARRVVVVAQEEARRLNHNSIAPEHVLLALLQADGIATRALQSLGVSPEDTARRIEEHFPPGEGPVAQGHIPFARGSKKLLELSLREASGLGHNYIGTEHILLGLLRQGQGDADPAVAILGVDADEVRAKVLELVAQVAPPGSPAAVAGMREFHRPDSSPALLAAQRRARRDAGAGQVTTGQLVSAFLEDPESQAAKALTRLGVTTEALGATLAEIPVAGTSDAPPPPPSVGFTVGGRTTTIGDPALAAALSALSPEELRAALRRAVGTDPEPGLSAAGSGG